ncbi:MAG: response regulator, partial [Ardenticatenaceae bacterium]
MSNLQATTIILVEDDLGHARLIEKNLRRAKITNKIIQLHDGQQALDYLFGQREQARPPLSRFLMLLDLNLPVLNGMQVLQRIKNDSRTKRIPVVILSTTDDPREVEACYELGCNLYITKPVEYAKFSQTIRQLGQVLSVVTLPATVGRVGAIPCGCPTNTPTNQHTN